MKSEADTSNGRCTIWSCFGRCSINTIARGNKKACLQLNTPRNGKYDQETEKRITQWILESSLYYEIDSKPPTTPDNTSAKMCFVRNQLDSLECSSASTADAAREDPYTTANEPASAEFNSKSRDESKWKGRPPADYRAESHSTSSRNDASQVVRTELRFPPHPTHWHTTSRLIPILPPAPRDIGAGGRMGWI